MQFSCRSVTDDGYGNTRGAFVAQFTVWARVQPRLGGETVMQARLAGTQPAVIRVRQSSQTRQIETDWLARNIDAGVSYNIRSIVDPYEGDDRHGRWLDMLVETGVAET